MNDARLVSVEQEARTLVERLGGIWGANGGMCRCPAHEDRTPSLSVRRGRSRILLHCFAGCAAGDILRALQSVGALVPDGPATDPAGSGARPDMLGAAARRLWDEARSIEGSAAADYLETRGLRSNSPQLRFHPRTPWGAGPSTRYLPALLAAVRDECGLVAIHRTFIERPAPGRPPQLVMRRGLGRLGGGAVRLGGTATRLGLAEGIETALSASALFGLPCWATLGSERFARVLIPDEVEELRLFVDNDSAGRRAGRRARVAFAAVQRIRLHCPTEAGADWNDVLRGLSSRPGSEGRRREAG